MSVEAGIGFKVSNVKPVDAVGNSFGNVKNVFDPVLFDTFTGTNGTTVRNHTPDIGSAATAILGTEPQIQSNQLTAMAAGANRALWDSGITNKVMQYSCPVNALQVIGLVRYQDGGNRYYVVHSTGGLFAIVSVIASAFTTVASATVAFSAGETITIVDDGNNITADIDGANTITAATTTFNTATQIGIQLQDATTTIDNLIVRAL